MFYGETYFWHRLTANCETADRVSMVDQELAGQKLMYLGDPMPGKPQLRSRRAFGRMPGLCKRSRNLFGYIRQGEMK